MSGRIVLELDDGQTCELATGDTVVQNGTRHAWRNPFDETCLMVVVLIGANHADLGRTKLEPTFEFTAPLWLHSSGSWVFLTVPEDESDIIRELAPHIGGFGSVRVRVSVGGNSL